MNRSKSEASLDKSKVLKRKFHDLDSAVKEKNENIEVFQSVDWLKKFQPKELSELAVHPKKLEELKNWFNIRTKVPNKILVVEGPAGCAKSTTLKLIAKENNYDVSEWINSTDVETALLRDNPENFQSEFTSYENQITKFTDFLLRTSRFQSVFKSKKSLLLVKDFPNTFMKKTEEFWDILKMYVEDGGCPLVFIITDTNSKSLNVSRNLFPDKIRLTLGIDTVNMNPVSTTMMKRGIKRVIQMIDSNSNYKLYFQRPTEDVINNLLEQSQGDIRNAILNLSFASQKNHVKPMIKTSKLKKSSKKEKSSNDGGIGKSEALTVMHGLGRVFYPKLEINSNSGFFELTHKPEEIAEAFSSQPSNIISLIHSNYIKNFSDIDSVAEAAEVLSMSDCFESELRDDQLKYINLNLVIRSTMILNKVPVSGFRPITSYANKKWKNAEEINKEKFKNASRHLNNGNVMARDNFFCDYNCFLSLINK